jgi:peptidoglycan/LPS O-acetylase OafA/YrhL
VTEGQYRPHLDGLRAVAVYLVVFFHAGSDSFSGGYIGVDVFFVLSGFLVTQLLVRDIASGGAIRYARFYARRFRRLLPAAFVTLLVTGFVYTALASPVEVSNAVGSFKAAFLYSTNWYFIHQAGNYFAAPIATSPLLHFWSLAVEEQFYLVWPLALGGAFALTRRMDEAARLRAIRIAVGVGALASMIWALSFRTSDPNHAYYGTDTRAYEMLAGALLALSPGLTLMLRGFRRTVRAAAVGGLVAVAALASSWTDIDAVERGIAITLTTCVILLVVEAADGGLMQRALSVRPIVYLGQISYGTYLWHWLVILVVAKAFRLSTIATVGITCLVATALASLSFELLEQPVRLSKRLDGHRRMVIATGLTISIVSALVLIPKIVAPSNATAQVVRDSASARLTPIPADYLKGLNPGANFRPPCPAERCPAIGTGPPILLLGDSQAQMLVPLFRYIARREGSKFAFVVQGGCPWQRDLYTGFDLEKCKTVKTQTYERKVKAFGPGLVVVAELAYGSPGSFTQPLVGADGKRVAFSAQEAATRASLASLRATGSDVMILESLPLMVDHTTLFAPFACLSKAKVVEDCRYRTTTLPTPAELSYRELEKHDPKVHSLDLDKAVCPLLPVCDPMVGDTIVKLDTWHLTGGFALSLAPEVDTYLKVEGIVPA